MDHSDQSALKVPPKQDQEEEEDYFNQSALETFSQWSNYLLVTTVAAVGWMEADANEADFEAKSETVKLVTSEDSTVSEPSYAQVKLIVERRTKKIRGCVIIGHGAAEVINLAALAIQSDVTTGDLERLLLVTPSVSLALQRCAAKFR